jgi:hypothetical protein
LDRPLGRGVATIGVFTALTSVYIHAVAQPVAIVIIRAVVTINCAHGSCLDIVAICVNCHLTGSRLARAVAITVIAEPTSSAGHLLDCAGSGIVTCTVFAALASIHIKARNQSRMVGRSFLVLAVRASNAVIVGSNTAI